MSKIYAFAFLRFAFSIAQRNWFRKAEKPKVEMPETKKICDKNIREGKFEEDQFQLPYMNGMLSRRDGGGAEGNTMLKTTLHNQ